MLPCQTSPALFKTAAQESLSSVRTTSRRSRVRLCLALLGHLDYLNSEFVTYYNTKRAHMEREHLRPIRYIPEKVDTLTMDQIVVKSYVGGLVKSLERKVA